MVFKELIGMMSPSNWFEALDRSLRSHGVRNLEEHELERTRTRAVVVVSLGVAWILILCTGHDLSFAANVVLAIGAVYGLASFLYGLELRGDVSKTLTLVSLTLLLDPVLLICVLAVAPEPLAIMNTFILLVIVRSAFRYGLPSMYLSWGAALAASPLLLLNSFWLRHVEFALAFVLALALIPLFFASFIARGDIARRVEEEQVRVLSMRNAVAARTRFITRVGHELRSPLQGIVSALDVLEMRRGRTERESNELLHRIRRSAVLLNTHLRDLLTLAKSDAGQLSTHPQIFDAAALVEAIGESAGGLAAAKGLTLRIELPTDQIFVVADGPRIDQILTNLVVNSVQNTDYGEVRIVLKPYSSSDRLLRFVVGDSGPGLPTMAQEILSTASSNQVLEQHQGPGSGLGLAIVRALVDLLGGQIYVNSNEHGTRVTIEIPAEPAASEVDLSKLQGDGRILIVDDREDVLDALTTVAIQLGFECDVAPSAGIATNLLAARSYEAMLVDIEMPIKSGIDLALDARSPERRNSNARLIGITAGDITDTARAVFDACLTKPVDIAALRQALGISDLGFRPSQPGLWHDEAAALATDDPRRHMTSEDR